MTKWYKRFKIDKGKGRGDNGQEPVSSKSGSPMDLAANKNFRGSSINDPSRAAAASSNELPNQPPHPENDQTQGAGAKGLDPDQQTAHQQEMAKQKAESIHRKDRIDAQAQLFKNCFEEYNDLMNKIPAERRRPYQRRLEEIRVTFSNLFNGNELQTTSATKHRLPFIKSRFLGRDQRNQAEIGIRELVRQFTELTRKMELRESLHASAQELMQHNHESYTLWLQTHSYFDPTPENYSPYYSMKGVKDKKSINIDSTLPESDGIRAIRWTLSRLGRDIYKDATEQEVAKLAGHSEQEGIFINKMQEAFKHFGIEYAYTHEILTIGDIKKVTDCGYPVLTHVYKEGIGGSFAVIEKVSRAENNDHICTIFDPHDPNNQKIRRIPYRELQFVLSDKHLLPTNWRELTKNLSESTPKTAFIKNLLAKHQIILQQSEQALADYRQLRSDPQKYERKQQVIKEEGDLLLKKLHKAQRGTTNLRPYCGSQRASLETNTQTEASPLTTTPTAIESLDKNEIKIEAQILSDLQKLEKEVAQYKKQYPDILKRSEQALAVLSEPLKYAQEQEAIEAEGADLLQQLHNIKTNIDKLSEEEQKIIIDDELWEKYVSKHNNKDYTQQEEIQVLYAHIRAQLRELHTPEDKIFIQQQKLFSLYRDSMELHKKIANVLNEDTPFTIKIQLQQMLTPEDKIYIQKEKFEDSCIKLKEISKKMTASSQTI